MTLILKPGTSFVDAYRRAAEVAPEALHQDRVLNFWGGEWHRDGVIAPATSPVDGSPIAGPPFLDLAEAEVAMSACLGQARQWVEVPLTERNPRVLAAVDAISGHELSPAWTSFRRRFGHDLWVVAKAISRASGLSTLRSGR